MLGLGQAEASPSHHCVHLRTKYTPQLSSGSCAGRSERPAAADQGFRQSHDFIEVVFWWGSLHKGTLNFGIYYRIVWCYLAD